MRIAFASDFHLGNKYARVEKTREHGYLALEELKNKLLSINPDLLIIGGDIFDSPNVDTRSLFEFLKFIMELNANGIGVITISGNHDGKYWGKENFEYQAPFILYKIKNYLKRLGAEKIEYYSYYGLYRNKNSVDWKTLKEIEDKYGLPIVGFSYRLADDVKNLLVEMQIINEQLRDYIVVMHQSIKEIINEPAAIEKRLIDQLLSNAQFKLFGHMHKKHFEGNLLVAPSLYSLDYSESVIEKGFWLIEDKNYKFIPIDDKRKFIIAEVDLVKGDIPKIQPDPDAILVVKAVLRPEQSEKLQSLINRWRQQFLYVNVKRDVVTNEAKELAVKAKATREKMNKEDILREYLGKDYMLFKYLYDKFKDANEDILYKYISDEENLDKLLNLK